MSEKRVFVTGISGFCGAHVLNELLHHGYFVRGTVRSQRKADFIIKKYEHHKNNLEITIVEDSSIPHAFDSLVKDVHGIIHVASPVVFSEKNIKKDIVDPAIQFTHSILGAAAQSTTVKRVVVMSSIVAIYDFFSQDAEHIYTEKDWNPLTLEQAETAGAHAGYIVSKVLSEKFAWKYMEENKPAFDLVVLNPTWVFGPMEHQVEKLADLNESCKLIADCMNGKTGDFSALEVQQHYVDVRDLAGVTRLAYESPAAANQRYIVSAGPYHLQQVLDLTHDNFPEKNNAPKGHLHSPPKLERFPTDNSKATKEFGVTYLPREKTFLDLIKQLVSMQ